MNRKQRIGLAGAAVILISIWFIPSPEGLSPEGVKTLGLLLAALMLWVTEAIPIAVTALALIALQPVYGIASPGVAFTNFINSVFFFVIASYGLSIAVMNTTFINRMANFLLRRTGGSAFKVVLAMTSSVALLSAFISNVPSCAVFMGFALGMLEPLEEGPRKEGLTKTLMIAIPFGAMIGGLTTPAGSSVNILALDLLESATGTSISFLEWMLYGVPIVILSVPFTVFVLMKLFKPMEIGKESVEIIIGKTRIDKPFTGKEKKLVIILMFMMGFWIAGTWVPAFNITIVALAGLIIMFIPGIDILNWDSFMKGVSWDAVIMIGGVSSIGSAVTATGVSSWFMNEAVTGLLDMGMIPLIALIGMFLNLIHLVLPIGPAIVAVGAQPLIDLAEAMSHSPVTFIITLSFMAGMCLLLPLDAVPLITYTKNHYTMWDMFKAGIIVSTAIVIMLAFWGNFAGGLLGY